MVGWDSGRRGERDEAAVLPGSTSCLLCDQRRLPGRGGIELGMGVGTRDSGLGNQHEEGAGMGKCRVACEGEW